MSPFFADVDMPTSRKQQSRGSRWTTHDPESFCALATVFRSLADLADQAATIMRERKRPRVTIEHWAGCRKGIGIAQRFLLAATTKARGEAVPDIFATVEQISQKARAYNRVRKGAGEGVAPKSDE
jgi:hypothetical protein